MRPDAALSPMMRECILFMQKRENKIHRHPGGFWAAERWIVDGIWFGTATVHALISRGVADYTKWQVGRNGTFPVEATLRLPA